MNFDFKNMMLACLGHLNIQWDWPRCPSSWHSRHLYPFVMLNFQCLVASSLGQSMPHSCSLKDPMCFPFFSFFSISGYMPATKIKSLHSTAGSENIWQLCCQNLFHTAITISKTNVGSSTKSSEKQNQWTLWDHVIPSAFYSFHLISFTRIATGPSQHKKWIYTTSTDTTQHPKAQQKITCQCTNPFCHLTRATPKTTRKPFRGHGLCGPPRPPRPPQRSAARPRRRGRSQPQNAAASRLGRRGCDADGGAAAAAVEKQSDSHGMFLRVVGQNYRS